MTINYTIKNGLYYYHTDKTKPRERGKYIGGIAAKSLEAVKQSVATYLGHNRFDVVKTPNVQSSGTRDQPA